MGFDFLRCGVTKKPVKAIKALTGYFVAGVGLRHKGQIEPSSEILRWLIVRHFRLKSPFQRRKMLSIHPKGSPVMTISPRDWWDNIAMSGKDWPGQFKKAVGIEADPSDIDLDRMLSLKELKLDGSKVLDDVRPLVALKKLTKLTLPQSVGISLDALQETTSLTNLDLNTNYLNNIAFLQSLSGLRRLNLDGNRIEDLSPLTGLPDLEVLSLRQNKVRDLGSLENLKKLQVLDILKNEVTSLAPLKALHSLERICAGDNKIADLGDLSGLESLEYLDVAHNDLHSLAAVFHLPKLNSLDASGNPIETAAGIENLKALVSLHLDGAGLADLAWVKDLTALDWLWLRETRISRLDELASLPVLRNFLLYSSVPVDVSALGRCKRLASLHIDAPDVTGIEALAKCKSLKSFQVDDHVREKRKNELRALAKLRKDIDLEGE